MSPNTVSIVAERVERVDIPVQPTIVGVPAEGFLIDVISTTPKIVPLLISVGGLVPDFIATQEIDVPDLEKSKTVTVLVEPPSGTRPKRTNAEPSYASGHFGLFARSTAILPQERDFCNRSER